jgi:hypothetical protein
MGYESIDVTRMGIKAIAVALLLAAWPAVSLHAEGERPSVAVYYPGLPWQLRYELEGVVEDYNNHRPGVSTYTMARSETSGMLVSAQISPAKEAKSARDCRDAEHSTSASTRRSRARRYACRKDRTSIWKCWCRSARAAP